MCAKSWCVGENLRWPERAPLGRYERLRTHPLSTCRWPMFGVRFCVRLAAALSASGKALRGIGIWSIAQGAWHRLPGATRSPWQGQSPWRSALLFMPETSSAVWTVPRCLHNLAVFMAGGSPRIWLGRSRARPAVVAGSGWTRRTQPSSRSRLSHSPRST